jgi:hypothetical protein
LLTWIGGGIHAVAVSGDAVQRINGRSNPAVDAARLRMERRAQGRHLLAAKPALAREAGVGRPDIPGADDYGLVDVNDVPASVLTRLPGVTEDLAGRIVQQRAQAGGFSSAEDLGILLDLSPAEVSQIRDLAVFIPDLPVRPGDPGGYPGRQAGRQDRTGGGERLPMLSWHPPEATYLAWLDCTPSARTTRPANSSWTAVVSPLNQG